MTTATQQGAAVLRRLREVLLRQRAKFQDYLDLLEREGDAIACGDVERLQIHLEVEKGVIAEIQNLRKIVEPLEDLYQSAYPRGEDTIPVLKVTLARMGAQVKERNARNRAALQDKMNELRREISGMRAWPQGRPVYREVTPSLVDITM